MQKERHRSFEDIGDKEDEPPPDNRNLLTILRHKLCILVHSFEKDIRLTAFGNTVNLRFSMDRRTASFCRHR